MHAPIWPYQRKLIKERNQANTQIIGDKPTKIEEVNIDHLTKLAKVVNHQDSYCAKECKTEPTLKKVFNKEGPVRDKALRDFNGQCKETMHRCARCN